MRKGRSIKSIKRFPLIFLALVLFYFALWLSICLSTVGQSEVIDVSVNSLKQKTITNVDLGESSFYTGKTGRLYWQVKNVKEALLIGVADADAPLPFLDLAYFIILNIFLFWLVSGIQEDNMFAKLATSLRVMSLLIFLYPVLFILHNHISGYIVAHLTDNRFTVQYKHVSLIKYVLLSLFFNLLYPFISKGKSLQQEQNID